MSKCIHEKCKTHPWSILGVTCGYLLICQKCSKRVKKWFPKAIGIEARKQEQKPDWVKKYK